MVDTNIVLWLLGCKSNINSVSTVFGLYEKRSCFTLFSHFFLHRFHIVSHCHNTLLRGKYKFQSDNG